MCARVFLFRSIKTKQFISLITLFGFVHLACACACVFISMSICVFKIFLSNWNYWRFHVDSLIKWKFNCRSKEESINHESNPCIEPKWQWTPIGHIHICVAGENTWSSSKLNEKQKTKKSHDALIVSLIAFSLFFFLRRTSNTNISMHWQQNRADNTMWPSIYSNIFYNMTKLHRYVCATAEIFLLLLIFPCFLSFSLFLSSFFLCAC